MSWLFQEIVKMSSTSIIPLYHYTRCLFHRQQNAMGNLMVKEEDDKFGGWLDGFTAINEIDFE